MLKRWGEEESEREAEKKGGENKGGRRQVEGGKYRNRKRGRIESRQLERKGGSSMRVGLRD